MHSDSLTLCTKVLFMPLQYSKTLHSDSLSVFLQCAEIEDFMYKSSFSMPLWYSLTVFLQCAEIENFMYKGSFSMPLRYSEINFVQ